MLLRQILKRLNRKLMGTFVNTLRDSMQSEFIDTFSSSEFRPVSKATMKQRGCNYGNILSPQMSVSAAN